MSRRLRALRLLGTAVCVVLLLFSSALLFDPSGVNSARRGGAALALAEAGGTPDQWCGPQVAGTPPPGQAQTEVRHRRQGLGPGLRPLRLRLRAAVGACRQRPGRGRRQRSHLLPPLCRSSRLCV